jgi:hypothetical protein
VALENLGLDLRDPQVYVSPQLTAGIWEDILVGAGGVWSEFLWDDDWRMGFLMDVPQTASQSVTDLAGINLELVHRLPHTPTDAEARMAGHFIRYVVFRDEVIEEQEKSFP